MLVFLSCVCVVSSVVRGRTRHIMCVSLSSLRPVLRLLECLVMGTSLDRVNIKHYVPVIIIKARGEC